MKYDTIRFRLSLQPNLRDSGKDYLSPARSYLSSRWKCLSSERECLSNERE